MRIVLTHLLVVILLASACGEDEKPAPPAAPAEPHTRGSGEECVKPEDCREGLWCLNGRCKEPLGRGMRKKEELERMQDERYEQLNDRVHSIEESLRE